MGVRGDRPSHPRNAYRGLTAAQLETWELHLQGESQRGISYRLDLARTTVGDRLDAANPRLRARGVVFGPDGQPHLSLAALRAALDVRQQLPVFAHQPLDAVAVVVHGASELDQVGDDLLQPLEALLEFVDAVVGHQARIMNERSSFATVGRHASVAAICGLAGAAAVSFTAGRTYSERSARRRFPEAPAGAVRADR